MYVYNDKDNVPMNSEQFDQPPRYHNPTTFSSYEEMIAYDNGTLDEEEHENDPCCNTCIYFDGDYCEKNWNETDDYHDIQQDRKNPDDCCDDYEEDA